MSDMIRTALDLKVTAVGSRHPVLARWVPRSEGLAAARVPQSCAVPAPCQASQQSIMFRGQLRSGRRAPQPPRRPAAAGALTLAH